MARTLSAIDPEYPHRPWTICFYGARGGAGCTTLLASVARDLEGVFLLDMNLQSPGIDEFRVFEPPSDAQSGLVEYARAYRDTGEVPELREFVYSSGSKRYLPGNAAWALGLGYEPPVEPEELPFHERYVMRAGLRDTAYCREAAVLDWSRFLGIEESRLFFENLRAGVWDEFDCEYMLVDAPSGLLEVGGLCTSHLADAVVFVVEPTTASVKSLPEIVRQVRLREESEGRPIPRLYVASKMPSVTEEHYHPEAWKVFADVLSRCEDGDVDEVYHNYGELKPDDFSGATQLCIPLRAQVAEPHLPDGFLPTVSRGASTDDLPESQHGYVFVNHWAKRCLPDVLSRLEVEGERREQEREAMRKIGEADEQWFARWLEGWRENDQLADMIAQVPSEILSTLPRNRELAVRRQQDERRRGRAVR